MKIANLIQFLSMNKPAKKSKLLTSGQINSGFNSWEKIQTLIEQEETKENLINFQEEVESALLESIDLNWSNMDNLEKKLAIQLGCLVKDLKKNLKSALNKSQH